MEKASEIEGLKVIWIGFQDKESKIRDFISKLNITKDVGYDNNDKISKAYGVNYGAGVVIIDGSGTVKARLAKGFSEQKLREALNNALNPGKKQRG